MLRGLRHCEALWRRGNPEVRVMDCRAALAMTKLVICHFLFLFLFLFLVLVLVPQALRLALG
ncbi:MAG: hypothetical protein IPO43_15925 [Rhodoferax sp.]|nr:hypothetical protein [Rhodoferax sp.]